MMGLEHDAARGRPQPLPFRLTDGTESSRFKGRRSPTPAESLPYPTSQHWLVISATLAHLRQVSQRALPSAQGGGSNVLGVLVLRRNTTRWLIHCLKICTAPGQRPALIELPGAPAGEGNTPVPVTTKPKDFKDYKRQCGPSPTLACRDPRVN